MTQPRSLFDDICILFDGTIWTTYTTADGLASDYVFAIDGEGHKWFGTWGSGVSEYFVGYLVYLPLVVKNAP